MNFENEKLTDLEYILHMIPHHQIAVDMSEQIIQNTKNAPILALSRAIIRSQKYEIWEMSAMKKMFTDTNNSHSNTIDTLHSTKKSNITETEYLDHMIPHHQIAIDMSKKLLLYTSSTYLIDLANKVIVQQKKEISFMTGLLDKTTFKIESQLLE
jgi:uncharacterized protein (DUF305 family)